MSRLKRLIVEIHHRSKWQVLLVYVAVDWAFFAIVQTATKGLGFPPSCILSERIESGRYSP